MNIRSLIPIALIATGGAASAGQPISTSLAECSAIFGEISGFTSAGSTPERRAKAADWSRQFEVAALAEAEREGLRDPAGHVAAALERREAKWSDQIRNPARLQETKDWIDYCKALGRDRAIPGV